MPILYSDMTNNKRNWNDEGAILPRILIVEIHYDPQLHFYISLKMLKAFQTKEYVL